MEFNKERSRDGLLCLFVFSRLLSLIFFNLPLIFISKYSLFLLQNQFLVYSVVCQVAELKSELKLRSLTASSTKNSLIERLRNYQKPNGGCGTTSSPTAGGTAEPGVEGADQSSKTTVTTTDNKSEHLQHLCPCHQTSSLTGESADHKKESCFLFL